MKQKLNKFIELSYACLLGFVIISTICLSIYEFKNVAVYLTGEAFYFFDSNLPSYVYFYIEAFTIGLLHSFSHYFLLPILIVLSYYSIKNSKFKIVTYLAMANFILQVFYDLKAEIVNNYEGVFSSVYMAVNGSGIEIFLLRLPTILLAITMCYLYLKEEKLLTKSN